MEWAWTRRKAMGRAGFEGLGTCAQRNTIENGVVPTRVGVNRRQGMPRKVRQLIADVKRVGMVLLPDRGKGSHRIFMHRESGTQVTISGHTGDDADRYQEGHVREALEAIRLWRQEREA